MTAYRTAQQDDMTPILRWAAAEGWNPGQDDATAFHAADPAGFFVALDEQGSPVGAISVVNHSKDFAFLGLYLVQAKHRGRGIGFGLWNHALAHAGTRTVGLDGVEAQQSNYAKSGFLHAGGTTRFTGTLAGAAQESVRLADRGDLDRLVALEAQASGWRKPSYLRAWFTHTATRQTFVDVQAGQIQGLCTIRDCDTGSKIGPLIAVSDPGADRLIRAALAARPGPTTIDVPDSSAPLAAYCHAQGLSPGFKTARMYRGPFTQPSDPQAFYAVTSLELG